MKPQLALCAVQFVLYPHSKLFFAITNKMNLTSTFRGRRMFCNFEYNQSLTSLRNAFYYCVSGAVATLRENKLFLPGHSLCILSPAYGRFKLLTASVCMPCCQVSSSSFSLCEKCFLCGE